MNILLINFFMSGESVQTSVDCNSMNSIQFVLVFFTPVLSNSSGFAGHRLLSVEKGIQSIDPS